MGKVPPTVPALVIAWIAANPQTECGGPARAALLASIRAAYVAAGDPKSPKQLGQILHYQLARRDVFKPRCTNFLKVQRPVGAAGRSDPTSNRTYNQLRTPAQRADEHAKAYPKVRAKEMADRQVRFDRHVIRMRDEDPTWTAEGSIMTVGEATLKADSLFHDRTLFNGSTDLRLVGKSISELVATTCICIYFCISMQGNQDKVKEWLAFLQNRGSGRPGRARGNPILIKTDLQIAADAAAGLRPQADPKVINPPYAIQKLGFGYEVIMQSAVYANNTQVEGYLQDRIDHMSHPRKLHRIAGAGGNVPPPADIDYIPREFAIEDEDIHELMMSYSFDVPVQILAGRIMVNP